LFRLTENEHSIVNASYALDTNIDLLTLLYSKVILVLVCVKLTHTLFRIANLANY